MSTVGQTSHQRATPACGLCNNRIDNSVFDAKEMMFGTRTRSLYLECGSCGCVQLLPPPPDPAIAYPSDYYSLSQEPAVNVKRGVRFAKSVRTAIALRLPSTLVRRAVARNRLRNHFEWFTDLGVRLDTSILDVGSGNGAFCAGLYAEGFRDLTGIDPFVTHDHELAPGLWIYRGDVGRLTRRYRVITMSHTLEHVSDQHTMLCSLRAHLAPGGALIIRIPVADSDAWQTYRTDWVSLDPPRHLFIHTERSLRRLASECGFSVVRAFRDSVGLQFWGSEQYRRGIPLMSDRSLFRNSSAATFTKQDLAKFEAEAARLNRQARGDWAGFVLHAVEDATEQDSH